MFQAYVNAVSEHYFSLLIPTAIAFIVFSATAPFLGPEHKRPKPLGLVFAVSFALVFWPVVVPLALTVTLFLAIIGMATLCYGLADKFTASNTYKDWIARTKRNFA